MFIVFFVTTIVFLILWLVEKKRRKADSVKLNEAESTVAKLIKYQGIPDAEAHADKLLSDATASAAEIKNSADVYAQQTRKNADDYSHQVRQSAEDKLHSADNEAHKIVADATAKATEIAGSAITDKEKAAEYKATAEAIKRTIEGYGDEWLKPSISLLDDLAEEFGYTEAGIELKKARLHSAEMVKEHRAATCDYVEVNRRETAIAFVVDAFNGKVDSILSKVKHDNYGKLEQKIRDAFNLVNYNGTAFRSARITDIYLESRLNELHWAVVAQELKRQEQEQQRLIREQMREEERARREYEKAIKDAAKEEAMLNKAMEKAKALLAKASDEERAKYEAQLADLEVKLKEAEERSQRTKSLAEQTRHGNVYVISNIGSFGENVYKVGMTRRLNPLDRVRELGDASVPFPFDVHAIIESDDAPALETALHKELALMQVNKVNPRKEFFRVPIASIKSLVEKRGLQAVWTIAAEATEYRESLILEEQLKSDPEARAKWEVFVSSVDSEDEDAEAI